MILALPHSGNWDAAGVWLVDWLGGPFMTVAERLKPESLYQPLPRLPRVPGHAGRPAHRGAAARSTCSGEWLTAAASTCLLVDRNFGRGGVGSPSSAGRPSMPGGAGAAGRAHRRRPLPAVASSTGAGWRISFHPEVPVAGEGRLRRPRRRRDAARGRRLHRRPRRAPRGLAHARPDLVRRAARRTPAGGSRGAAADAHRPRLPLPVGRPRWRAVPRARPGRDAARDGPPRRGAHPGRARGVAHRPVDHLRRAAPSRSRTTARWPACSSAPCRRRASVAGCATGGSTSSTCTSPRRAVGRPARLHDRRPGRSWPPSTRPPPGPSVLAAFGPGASGRGWRRSPAGSRCPTSPAGCRSSTSAATR